MNINYRNFNNHNYENELSRKVYNNKSHTIYESRYLFNSCLLKEFLRKYYTTSLEACHFQFIFVFYVISYILLFYSEFVF